MIGRCGSCKHWGKAAYFGERTHRTCRATVSVLSDDFAIDEACDEAGVHDEDYCECDECDKCTASHAAYESAYDRVMLRTPAIVETQHNPQVIWQRPLQDGEIPRLTTSATFGCVLYEPIVNTPDSAGD